MATEKRSTASHVLEAIGFGASILIGMGLIFTIVVVWVDSSTLSDIRTKFYDARNEAERTKYSTQNLESRMSALEGVWNKEHPDAKLYTGTTIFSTICASSGCAAR